MYDVEKRSAVLGDAAGFARRDAYMYGPVTKWWHWGMLIHWGTNFAFPRTLYSSECHRRLFLRGSDTSARPRV